MNTIFWNSISSLKPVFYSIKKKKLKRHVKVRSKKFFSKKIIKKSRSNFLLRLLNLNLFVNQLTNSQPLSGILNLLGINPQKFIDDVKKDFIFNFELLLNLRIFIKSDLSFEYIISCNYNFILKNFYNSFLIKNNLFFINNVGLTAIIKPNLTIDTNSTFTKRLFSNIDLFTIINFIYLNQFFFLNFNLYKNSFLFFYGLYRVINYYENLSNIVFNTLKTFNLKYFKILTK